MEITLKLRKVLWVFCVASLMAGTYLFFTPTLSQGEGLVTAPVVSSTTMPAVDVTEGAPAVRCESLTGECGWFWDHMAQQYVDGWVWSDTQNSWIINEVLFECWYSMDGTRLCGLVGLAEPGNEYPPDITTTTSTTTTSATTTTSEAPPTTATPTTAVPTTTTTKAPVPIEDVLTAVYTWGYSEPTFPLQEVLNINADGWYGNGTLGAHRDKVAVLGLVGVVFPTPPVVPIAPPPTTTTVLSPWTEPCQGIVCFEGYQGQYQSEVEAALLALSPPALAKTVRSVSWIINGCMPFSNRCTWGGWDASGWGSDGTHGHPWTESIWISNAAVESGELTDVAAHETAHAWMYKFADSCINPETGISFRNDIRTAFALEGLNDRETAADGITAYFYGPSSYQYYRGTGTGNTDEQTALLDSAFSLC